MELLPQRGVSEKDAQRRSWTWTNFDLVNRVLYRKSDKTHQQRKIVAELDIWDAIISIHNSLDHTGKDSTAKAIHTTYHRVTREEVIFLIELCEICH